MAVALLLAHGSRMRDIGQRGGDLPCDAVARASRLRGILLGTALGDALGLPMEGLSQAQIARRFGTRLDRFGMLGDRGFVSDDTEQAALVCQSLTRGAVDPDRVRAHLRAALLGWFWRLPFGIGLGTLRACLRLSLGRRDGVCSAGNGAMMRAPILGASYPNDPGARRLLVATTTVLTHTHPWAIDAAHLAAALTALCLVAESNADRAELARQALATLSAGELRERAQLAVEAAERNEPYPVERLGNTGFVMHTAALTLHAFVRWGYEPKEAIVQAILLGGDTDTHAAIVGAWCGALHGEAALPSALVDRIYDGPFGPTHLRALADALAYGHDAPRYSWPRAMLRNLALFPVVLGHGFSRLFLAVLDLARGRWSPR